MAFEVQNNRFTKILAIFFLFAAAFTLFVIVVGGIIFSERKLPKLFVEQKNRAIRGSIVTHDGFQLAYSNKFYYVTLNTKSLNPAKKDLFINLVAIYSGLPKKQIASALEHIGYVTLGKVDTKRAYQLRILAKDLYAQDFFVPYKVGKNRYVIQGLNVIESGERRVYPYGDGCTPILGYVHRILEKNYWKIEGVKGIEKYYEAALQPKQDGLLKGRRDIRNTIILNKNALIKRRIDGYNVHLHISLLLQRNVEHILDLYKKEFQAQEIIAAVMESLTGKIVALASTNRYNPQHIRKRDYKSLNASCIEYEFEPGSVMKPIIFALLLQKDRVDPVEVIKGYNGIYRLGDRTITDDHRFDWLSAENVIVYSSNIGIAQLAQRLSHIEYYNGLQKFGFGAPTGVDLPYEHKGKLLSPQRLQVPIYKASVGYGYGIQTTFMQLLQAYNAFNNGGYLITPRIADALYTPSGRRIYLPKQQIRRILSQEDATLMQTILQKVVQKGTGKSAYIDGLIIGGKTGTAKIAQKGEYTKQYNSSFFGFANDMKHRYTIGVVVVRPQKEYYAAKTAVPIFRDIVMELINEGYLNP